MVEEPLYFDDILKVLGWKKDKFFRKRQNLLDAGAIFYQWEGRPPTRRIRAFPSDLRSYLTGKSKKSEIL